MVAEVTLRTLGEAKLGEEIGVGLGGCGGTGCHAETVGMERVTVLVADWALFDTGLSAQIAEGCSWPRRTGVNTSPTGLFVSIEVGRRRVARANTYPMREVGPTK